MHQEGPRNIGLSSIKSYKFPITAISSILHRMTGIMMVIALPFLLWAFAISLSGEASFNSVATLLSSTGVSFFAWLFLSMISYHIIAGVRHMIMDIGFGESMCAAKATSLLVMVLGALIAVFWGVWIWVM